MLPGVTAFPFLPGDADSLARALRQALQLDTQQRAHIGEQAVIHVRANFTKDLMCARTLALYGELLEN